MVKKPLRVVLDTNTLISALIFGGKPEKAYNLVLEKQILAVTSFVLIAELFEILTKKFNFEQNRIKQLENIIREHFLIVQPENRLNIARDEDDNRVLEAALKGKCQFIITGDKDLLELGIFRKITILTAGQFINHLKTQTDGTD